MSIAQTEVTLDADHHYFADNGKRRWEIPGVSFLLEWKFGKNPFFKPHHARKGSLVHRACTLDDQGILDEGTVAPELAGYLAAWRKFKSEKSVAVMNAEFMVYDLQLEYAGTVDRLISWNRSPRPCVVDLKSGGKTDTHWLQLAAYVRASPEWRTFDGLLVYVKENGNYTLDFYAGRKLIDAVHYWEAIPREYRDRESKLSW
jgi:hypothetical protein